MIFKQILKGSMLFIFFTMLAISPLEVIGQEPLGWNILADVTFTEKWDEDLQAYWLIPTFGKQPKAYENKLIILEGYFIPVDMENNFHVLSKYPYSSCFFCGRAGPETVVELQLDEKVVKRISMDQRITVQGTLVLNKSDYEHCNYILQAAQTLF